MNNQFQQTRPTFSSIRKPGDWSPFLITHSSLVVSEKKTQTGGERARKILSTRKQVASRSAAKRNYGSF